MVLEKVERCGIASTSFSGGAGCVELDAGRVPQLIESYLCPLVGAASELHCKLHRELVDIGLQIRRRGVGVFGVFDFFPIRHPTHGDLKVLETLRMAEAGDVIGVPVGHDGQRELPVRCVEEIFNSLFNRADVTFATGSLEHTTVDNDITISFSSRDSNQKEVTEPDAIHADL